MKKKAEKRPLEKPFLSEVSIKYLNPERHSTHSFRMIRNKYFEMERSLSDAPEGAALLERKLPVFREWSLELYAKALEDQGLVTCWQAALHLIKGNIRGR